MKFTMLLVFALSVLITNPARAGWETYDDNGDYVGALESAHIFGIIGSTGIVGTKAGNVPTFVPVDLGTGTLIDTALQMWYTGTGCTGTAFVRWILPGAPFVIDQLVYGVPLSPTGQVVTLSLMDIDGFCQTFGSPSTINYIDLIPLDPQPGVQPFEFFFLEPPIAPVSAGSTALAALIAAGLLLTGARRLRR